MFHSPRAGGYTFPENPVKSCALIQPIWSADVDPHVLKAHVRPHTGTETSSGHHAFDLRRFCARIVIGVAGEYVRINLGGSVLRLDVVAGTMIDGPVSLAFEIALKQPLGAQVKALRKFDVLFTTGETSIPPLHDQLAGQILALQAYDARLSGASLRMIAEKLLGQGDWPGDGEWRKSKARRLVATGNSLVRAGPRAILIKG